jgi:hypothetical protein
MWLAAGLATLMTSFRSKMCGCIAYCHLMLRPLRKWKGRQQRGKDAGAHVNFR